MIERWKDTCFPGYQVSTLGRVRSVDRTCIDKNGKVYNYKGRILRQGYTVKGYTMVGISHQGKTKTVSTHRLILETFNKVEGYESLQVNHIDGIKDNNRLDNLEWVNQSQNSKHAYNLKLHCVKGESNGRSKLTINQVENIKDILQLKKLTHKEIAKVYKVSPSTISAIATNRNWK